MEYLYFSKILIIDYLVPISWEIIWSISNFFAVKLVIILFLLPLLTLFWLIFFISFFFLSPTPSMLALDKK